MSIVWDDRHIHYNKFLPLLSSMNLNTQPPSRGELLKWINKRLPSAKVDKVERLGNGVAFLQLMNIVYPNCIKANKINFNANLDYENIANFKLLAAAFAEKSIKYCVDVVRLANRKYQDNLCLLQFMHKLVEENAGSEGNGDGQGK